MHMENAGGALRTLLSSIEGLAWIGAEDKEALSAVSWDIDTVQADEYLVREGVVTPFCCMVISGYICRHKTDSIGRRQIVSFHMAGDFLALERALMLRADHSIQSITNATVAWVSVDTLRSLIGDRPSVGEALWRHTLTEASIFREWVLNVARRGAKERVAHMLCEFASRHASAGLGGPQKVALPLTLRQIADATGLTSVHVSRVLRRLTEEGVLASEGKYPIISEWERMQAVANFDPVYLHQAA